MITIILTKLYREPAWNIGQKHTEYCLSCLMSLSKHLFKGGADCLTVTKTSGSGGQVKVFDREGTSLSYCPRFLSPT